MAELVPARPLTDEESHFLREVLLGRACNHRFLPSTGRLADLARGLADRGLGALSPMGGFSVTTAGARALAAAGAVTTADLARDLDRLADWLRWRAAVVAAGLSDPSVDDGWDLVPSDPFGRVAFAVLRKRGSVEAREVDGVQQMRWAS